jgi:hypothetical protein
MFRTFTCSFMKPGNEGNILYHFVDQVHSTVYCNMCSFNRTYLRYVYSSHRHYDTVRVDPPRVSSSCVSTPSVLCTLRWGAKGHFIHAGTNGPGVPLLLLQSGVTQFPGWASRYHCSGSRKMPLLVTLPSTLNTPTPPALAVVLHAGLHSAHTSGFCACKELSRSIGSVALNLTASASIC